MSVTFGCCICHATPTFDCIDCTPPDDWGWIEFCEDTGLTGPARREPVCGQCLADIYCGRMHTAIDEARKDG